MSNKITIGILLLMLASGFIFISHDRSDDDIKLMSEDDYINIDKDYKEDIAENSLRELDRLNRKLGVDPSDLADPRTRRVSQQARDFVETEKTNKTTNRDI